MTIQGILQLLSTKEKISTVVIDNDIFSLNQIQQILQFQNATTRFLYSEDWWKNSKLLIKSALSNPALADLPNIKLLTPPYSLPLHTRIADILGLTTKTASKILETGVKFCAFCTKLNLSQSIEQIISECPSDTIAISAKASKNILTQHTFAKIIEGNKSKNFEDIADGDAPLEVVIERIKLSNPDGKARIARALDFIENNALTEACIHSWPIGSFKRKIELTSICQECGTPYPTILKMTNELVSAIWKLSPDSHQLLQELYNPLSNLKNYKYEILRELGLDYYSPAHFVKDLDPGHFHIIMIQLCILEPAEDPIIISPLNYLLSPSVQDYLLHALQKGMPLGSKTIATVLPTQTTTSHKNTTACKDIPNKLTPASHLFLTLNRATIDEESYQAISSAIPTDYKIYSLSHTHPRNSQHSQISHFLGIINHLARLYASHPTSKALGLGENFFARDAFNFSCAFCKGAAVNCTFCKGLPFPPDIYLVRFNGRTLPGLLEENITEAMKIVGRIPKIATILDAAMQFGLGSLRLNSTLRELNILDQWALKIVKFILKTSQKSCIILPDLRWCLTTSQLHYLDRQITHRLSGGGIIIEIRMELVVDLS